MSGMNGDVIKKQVLLDFEFTGLDSDYITDNEIIQAKALAVVSGKAVCKNFGSKIPMSAHVQLTHGVPAYKGKRKFSRAAFDRLLRSLDVDPARAECWGWGVEQDKKMLKKYRIEVEIKDVQERFRLSVEYEVRMAREGAGLEEVLFMVTGKATRIDHDGVGEMDAIRVLFDRSLTLTLKPTLTVMPYGFCRGMPITQYVRQNRRQADGYRFHNSDLLAASLSKAIPLPAYQHDDEDFGDEDDDVDDE